MIVTLETVRTALEAPPATVAAPKRAAVAMILTPNFDMIFIRRAEFPGDPWSGDVAFPGGRVETDDASARAAAVRETREEVGFDLEHTEFLGELDHVAPVSGVKPLAIEPFVFYAPKYPSFHTNHEVAAIYHVPIADLLRGEGRGRMTYAWQGRSVELPCVDFHGVRLWGLTLRVVDDLLHRLDGRGTGLNRR